MYAGEFEKKLSGSHKKIINNNMDYLVTAICSCLFFMGLKLKIVVFLIFSSLHHWRKNFRDASVMDLYPIDKAYSWNSSLHH